MSSSTAAGSSNDDLSRLSAALIELAADLIRSKRDPCPDDVKAAFGLGLARRNYHSPKEALQRFVARLDINADDKVVYKGTSLLVPAAEDWTDLVLRAHSKAHLRPHATWQEVSLIAAVDRRPL